jgi:type I restriction enzyme S subunit
MSLTISPARIVEESESPLLGAPESWPRQPLGDVAVILNGFAFKSKQFVPGGGRPLIRIRDIFNDRTVVGYTGEYDSRYLVHKDDLLVGMDGDFNCARWHGPEGLLNQRVCKITPDPEKLDIDYLTHILPGYLQAIHDVTSSTTVTHLSSRDVAQIPIPMPPLNEQRELAQLFGTVSSKQVSSSVHLQSARLAVERFRQALLAAACSGRLTADWRDQRSEARAVDLDAARRRRQLELGRRFREPHPNSHADMSDVPESWRASPLGLLLREIKYGTSKRSEHGAQGIPVLRIPNVSGERLDISDLKSSSLDPREAEALRLRLGDLLMIRSNGSVQLIGKAVPVTEAAVGMAYAGYLMRLRTDEEALDPRFLAVVLASPLLRRQIEMPARSTSGVNNINTGEVRGLIAPIPPLEEQSEIVRRTSQALDSTNIILAHINTASMRVGNSSQAVLAKAFRGDLLATGTDLSPVSMEA